MFWLGDNPERIKELTLSRILILISLIHEEVHALSKKEFEKFAPESKVDESGILSESDNFRKVKIGYGVVHINAQQTGGEFYYQAFDEGVTEKLAQEILVEYLKNDETLDSDIVDQFLDYLPQFKYDEGMSAYVLEQKLVESIIARIARRSGYRKEEIWQAIVRSKIEGVNVVSQQFNDFFDKNVYAEFSKQLKRTRKVKLSSTVSPVEILIKKIEQAGKK
jgi:hypothetical protein